MTVAGGFSKIFRSFFPVVFSSNLIRKYRTPKPGRGPATPVAPVLPPASSAIDSVHVPTAEAVAALGDSETNPVLKTLQQLQVVNKSI